MRLGGIYVAEITSKTTLNWCWIEPSSRILMMESKIVRVSWAIDFARINQLAFEVWQRRGKLCVWDSTQLRTGENTSENGKKFSQFPARCSKQNFAFNVRYYCEVHCFPSWQYGAWRLRNKLTFTSESRKKCQLHNGILHYIVEEIILALCQKANRGQEEENTI